MIKMTLVIVNEHFNALALCRNLKALKQIIYNLLK